MMTCDSSHGVGDIPYSKGANGNTVNFLFYTSTYFPYSTVCIKNRNAKFLSQYHLVYMCPKHESKIY